MSTILKMISFRTSMKSRIIRKLQVNVMLKESKIPNTVRRILSLSLSQIPVHTAYLNTIAPLIFRKLLKQSKLVEVAKNPIKDRTAISNATFAKLLMKKIVATIALTNNNNSRMLTNPLRLIITKHCQLAIKSTRLRRKSVQRIK